MVSEGALADLRVLEVAGPLGHYCGKLLADLGADVIKIEPPGGDEARHLVPFAGDLPHPERSLNFLYFNSNKRSIILDLRTTTGQETVKRLVATADVVIESFPPGTMEGLGLGYQALREINPGLVLASITGFGQTGPYRDYRATDLIGYAMGGQLFMSGDPEAAPCVAPGEQAYQLAGVHAAYAILAALRQRRGTGHGAHLDVSMQEVMASVYFTIVRYGIQAEIVARVGSSVPVRWCGIYLAEDGYASIYIGPPGHFKTFVEWIGSPSELREPAWLEQAYRKAHHQIFDAYVEAFARRRPVAWLTTEGQQRHLPIGPVNTPGAFLESDHVKERGFLVSMDHPVMGRIPFPRPAYRFSETPWRIRRPAPLLGEHNDEVLGAIKVRSLAPSQAASTAVPVASSANPGPRRSPLAGVRILDFCRVWAGPFGTRYLGDLGAEVIRVESRQRLDSRPNPDARPDRAYEQNCLFAEINRSKLSITVDMNTAQGQALIRRLVPLCDVVVENLSPSVIKRWDLDYPHLRQLKPDIIMINQPGFGKSGPLRGYVAFGSTVVSYTGMAYLWGHPNSDMTVRCQLSYPDFVAAGHAAFATLAALAYRDRTGKGQYVELALGDATATTLGVAYLDYLVNGREGQPQGNRSRHWAPHNCYRCRGEDDWCAVVCRNDEEWQNLCRALGDSSWTRDPRFATNKGRLEAVEELDRYIEEWTRNYTPHQAVQILQKAGVPAGAVQTGEDLFYDYHLRARGFILQVDHPETGPMTHAGIPVSIDGLPRNVVQRAPLLGEHNDYVLGDLLGMSAQEIKAMAEAGILI